MDVTQEGQGQGPEPRVPPRIGLFGDGGAHWRPVSPRLVTARLVGLASVLVIPLGAMLLLALLASDAFWIGVVLLLALGAVGVWMVRRQVSAITWAELDEELVIRRGRLLRSLVSVPYGRLQYVDVQSGPLSRRLGMARVELHTASPESGGSIPGLPIAEAEALRTRLAARGEAQRAGL